jgi:hypothetical protein
MIEKRKHDGIARQSNRTGAIILIAIGMMFLLINTGVVSFNEIGTFFGGLGEAFGTFFGNFGRVIGEIFGGLGQAFGEIFGGLIGSIANLWPLILILIGVALLFGRKPNRQGE